MEEFVFDLITHPLILGILVFAALVSAFIVADNFIYVRRKKRKLVTKCQMFDFAEWLGKNYVKLHGVWVHKYNDQRDPKNQKTTQQLYDLWIALNREKYDTSRI